MEDNRFSSGPTTYWATTNNEIQVAVVFSCAVIYPSLGFPRMNVTTDLYAGNPNTTSPVTTQTTVVDTLSSSNIQLSASGVSINGTFFMGVCGTKFIGTLNAPSLSVSLDGIICFINTIQEPNFGTLNTFSATATNLVSNKEITVQFTAPIVDNLPSPILTPPELKFTLGNEWSPRKILYYPEQVDHRYNKQQLKGTFTCTNNYSVNFEGVLIEPNVAQIGFNGLIGIVMTNA